jgi:hypothetical protein
LRGDGYARAIKMRVIVERIMRQKTLNQQFLSRRKQIEKTERTLTKVNDLHRRIGKLCGVSSHSYSALPVFNRQGFSPSPWLRSTRAQHQYARYSS